MHFLISATGTGPFGNLELFQVFLPHHVPGMSCMSGLLLSTATAPQGLRSSKKKFEQLCNNKQTIFTEL
jgi:hypothetical protein